MTSQTYVVQFGPFAWLNSTGTVTTVAAQAAQLEHSNALEWLERLNTKDGRANTVGTARNRWTTYLLTAPVAVVPYEVHAAHIAATAKAEGAKPAPVAEGQGTEPTEPAGEPAAPKPKGVTTLIREWVAANPQATKADTYAQFPDANRSTVNVQFGVARKG